MDNKNFDSFEFSYRERLDDRTFIVQSYKKIGTQFDFNFLVRLAEEYDGEYSFKNDNNCPYGGLGAFVFKRESDARNFQAEIDEMNGLSVSEGKRAPSGGQSARYSGGSYLNVGMQVQHKNLGYGKVTGLEDGKVWIRFQNGEIKKLDIRFLEHNNLLSF